MADNENSPGFFGKLPCNGDFVNRRLPRQTFLNTWDDWLQAAIAKSKEQLQDAWLSIYLTSPIWRFAVSPGVCGDNTWAGLLMPSVDKVGRYFPLTIACPLESTIHPSQLINEHEEWFGEAEKIALSALDDSIDLDRFDKDVQDLDPPNHQVRFNSSPILFEQSTSVHINIPSADEASSMSSLLMKSFFDTNYGDLYSIWWTNGSDRVKSCLITTPGLPPPLCYSALLDGDWAKWGWPMQIINNAPLTNPSFE